MPTLHDAGLLHSAKYCSPLQVGVGYALFPFAGFGCPVRPTSISVEPWRPSNVRHSQCYGGHAVFAQVAETLPAEVLAKMHAPPKADHPVIDAHTLDQVGVCVLVCVCVGGGGRSAEKGAEGDAMCR
jgi:hypothetical protein